AEPSSLRLELPAEASAANLDFIVAPYPEVQFQIVDVETGAPLPARVSLEGGGRALPLRRTLHEAAGRGSGSLPAGEYTARVSYGVEYHPVTRAFTVGDDEPTRLEVALQRAFRTEGWLAGDLASRIGSDLGSGTSLSARKASVLAEGLDWVAMGNPVA